MDLSLFMKSFFEMTDRERRKLFVDILDLDSLDHMFSQIEAQMQISAKKNCNCSVIDLMRSGCKCSGI